MLAKPWKYSQPIIAIDRVTNYNEIYHAEMELVGNIAEILTMLAEALPAEHKWDEKVAPAYRKKVYDALALPTQGLAPFRVSDITRELTSEDVILTTDVGASKLLLSQIWRPYQPNSMLMSNPLGTMGFGVPSAIAAKLVFPNRQVVSLCGDGGFSMRMAELQTAMQLGVAPVIVVLSDQALSQIKIKQIKKGLSVVGTEFRAPDYVRIAEAFGGRGISVGTEAEYADALKEALQSNSFTLIQARIDPSQYACTVRCDSGAVGIVARLVEETANTRAREQQKGGFQMLGSNSIPKEVAEILEKATTGVVNDALALTRTEWGHQRGPTFSRIRGRQDCGEGEYREAQPLVAGRTQRCLQRERLQRAQASPSR